MRRLILLVLALALLPALTAAAPLGAITPASPTAAGPGLPLDLQTLDFVDTAHGWAAGAALVPLSTAAGGRAPGNGAIIATTDGGRTWERQYDGPARIRQLDFVSAAAGWALGDTSLLRTTDSGRIWTPAGEPVQPLRRVQFLTGSLGYGTSADPQRIARLDPAADVLYATVDGGRSWTPLPTPIPVGGMCFTDPRHGWAVSAPSATTPAALGTSDGGRTWQAVAQPPTALVGALPSGTSRHPPIPQTLGCAAPDVLWDMLDFGPIGTLHGEAFLLARSDDGGSHWRPVVQHSGFAFGGAGIAESGMYLSGALDVVNAATAFLPGNCISCAQPFGRPLLEGTTDSGRTWRNFPLPNLPGAATAVSFPAPRQGWLAVRLRSPDQPYSLILYSDDGGATWKRQFPMPTGIGSLGGGGGKRAAPPKSACRNNGRWRSRRHSRTR